jgi:apolipoprotein N-acyltransferase
VTRAALHAPARSGRAHALPSRTMRFGSWAPALLSAGLVAASARPWGLGWLAWVAFAPAFAAVLHAHTPREGALVSAVAALGMLAVGYEAVAGIGIWAYAPVCLVATLPFAAAGAASVAFRRRAGVRAATIALPMLWCAAEWLPAQPWLAGRWALTLSIIGYSQAGLPAMQLARFSSVTATSLAVLLANALLLRCLVHRSARAVGGILALAALVAAAWWTRADASPAAAADTVRVRLVQPHLSDAERAAATALPDVREELLARLREASLRPVRPVRPAQSERPAHPDRAPRPPRSSRLERSSRPAGAASLGDGVGTVASDAVGGLLAADRPTLTIWPEAAWPDRLRHDGHAAFLSAVDAAWLDGLAPLLLGASARGGGGTAGPLSERESGDVPRSSNAAFLWTGASLLHVFDKRHLVPITEDGLAAGPGAGVVDVNGVSVAPAICYDAVFPSFARSAVRAGADLLAVLADDGFAARGDVPIQHLRVAAFRAVETARPLAFASNTGPSAVVDASGHVLARTGAGSQDVLVAALGIGAGPTPYVRYGDWVGALVCLTSIGWAALAGARGGATTRPPPQ